MVYIQHHNLQFPARLSDYFFIQSSYYSFTVVLLFNTGSLFFAGICLFGAFLDKSQKQTLVLKAITNVRYSNK